MAKETFVIKLRTLRWGDYPRYKDRPNGSYKRDRDRTRDRKKCDNGSTFLSDALWRWRGHKPRPQATSEALKGKKQTLLKNVRKKSVLCSTEVVPPQYCSLGPCNLSTFFLLISQWLLFWSIRHQICSQYLPLSVGSVFLRVTVPVTHHTYVWDLELFLVDRVFTFHVYR